MSISLKLCGLLLLASVAMCAQIRESRFAVSSEDIPNVDLTPPQDPAINNFPKAPSVPLMPTCVHAGYFRDPFNCGKFYHCEFMHAIPVTFYCQQGLIFNEQTEICDDPHFVDC